MTTTRILAVLLVLVTGCEMSQSPLEVTEQAGDGREILSVGAGGGDYAPTVLSDAPVAYWRFEEESGSVALDASGNSHHGTYLDGPVLGDSVGAPDTGNAVSLENETDGVLVEYGSWTDMPALSVEAWVRPSRVTSPEGMIVVDKGFTWNLFIDPEGRPAFQFPGGVPPETRSPTPVVAGETYHLVGTFQNGVMRLYVNGVLVSEATVPVTAIPARNAPIHVGRGVGAIRFEFYGVIDDVALYNGPLSADAIVRHYDAGMVVEEDPPEEPGYGPTVLSDAPAAYWRFEEESGPIAFDSSGNAHHGTFVDGPVVGDSLGAPHTGKALSLENQTDGVFVAYGAWTDMPALTVEAWVRPSRVTSPEGMIVVDKGSTWNLFIDPQGRPAFQFPGGVPPETWSPTPVVAGQTYHLVGTFQNRIMKLYVNGALVSEATVPVAQIRRRNAPIHLGRGLSAIRFEFYGVIDEVALYNRPLSEEAIVRHYDAGR